MMKKRILCIILTVLLTLGSGPLSVLSVVAETNAPPVVSVKSLYYNAGNQNPSYGNLYEEYRALPNDEGTFYFDIVLDKAPNADEEFLVYYRTVDDTAVASWGDYEGVGMYEEAYVKLNKDNGYQARVTINSLVLEHTFAYENTDKPLSRRFLFELTRVEGNAVLDIDDPNDKNDRDESEFYCYLRGEHYYYQTNVASIPSSQAPYVMFTNEKAFDMHYIWEEGSYATSLNYQFPEYFKNYVKDGYFELGFSMFGRCIEYDGWNSDGPVTFDLYYTYQGKTLKAFTLYIEGEFDESEFFGWEHAYDYFDPALDANDATYDEQVNDDIDIDDFVEDNFIGFTLYDNDGNVSHEVKLTGDRDDMDEQVIDKLKESLLPGGYASRWSAADGQGYSIQNNSLKICAKDLHLLKLPSNFVLADAYYYRVYSSTDPKEARCLEDVGMAFVLLDKDAPKIAKDEKGNQMVTTNLDSLKKGDDLKLAIRFDQPVFLDDPDNDCKVNVDVYLENKGEPVKMSLNVSQMKLTNPAFKPLSYYYAWDTFVFTGKLPPELEGAKISSLRNIRINYGTSKGFKSFRSQKDPIIEKINDFFNYSKDMRTPVATVTVGDIGGWVKAKSLDIYLNTQESSTANFRDYATVYYQWSDSPERPETYSSKLTFHSSEDGEIMKTIIGTGNGEMYLHLKSVSRYGTISYSDQKTKFYNPNDPNAVYTPFGPFKFDNLPPTLSAESMSVTGSMLERTITVPLPDDGGRSGVRDVHLYYVKKDSKDGEGTLLRTFTVDQFSPNLSYKISHSAVGACVDAEGNTVLAREEVEFYWVLVDKLGNTSEKTAYFKLVFDSHDYLSDEITSVGAYDHSNVETDAKFESNTQKVDDLTFVYDYKPNKDKNYLFYSGTEKKVYFGFAFTVDHTKFGSSDNGIYGANVSYKGNPLELNTDYIVVEETNGVYVVWFLAEMSSGRYEIQLTRQEGESKRVSQVYTVYATNGEQDSTATQNKIESGTLLSNSVYQLSQQYPYFYYKDSDGVVQQENYNNTKRPATFSSYAKAKEYVYYQELSDIYLVQLNEATASALNSGTAGYVIAKGEVMVPQAGQYWIRYKSESWTPTTVGDSSWVYYYYGSTGELSQNSLSLNLQNAIQTVSNRIVGYGKSVILTDASLFLGSANGDRLLDDYGMPYLLEGQIHAVDEMSTHTKCGNAWSIQVYFAADKNIYKSNVYVGEEGSANYEEYPIVGNFVVPSGSRFQYMSYEEYSKFKEGLNADSDIGWNMLIMEEGKSFIDVFTSSGIYYIREISNDGISVFAIYVDKEAPKVSFSKNDGKGGYLEIPVDGVEITEIRTKDLFIGRIDAGEYDRLSYVAIYKVSDLSLVGVYTADDLQFAPVQLEDGNYYIVVSDRSGNHYTVTAKVSSSDLECLLKESTNKFLKLTCNRRTDQILRYEVYLNGDLVTSTYAAEQTFDKAGLYSIYVQDIYGNFFSQDVVFNRDYPAVEWKYLGSDGKYHAYDPETPNTDGFVMTWAMDNQYKISTSVKTRFSFTEGYGYEFVGGKPEYKESVGAETTVTIEAGQSFTLKVYYKSHSDCYTIYTGIVDITPPSINVSAEVDVLRNGEYESFEAWIKNNAVKLDQIYYKLHEIGRKTVLNGSTITSDIVKVNANDANDLSLVEVYLNGELIQKQDVKSGFSQIIVSRWGDYRIVAKDTLGNVSEFTFTNGKPNYMEYFVDGVQKETELHGYLNFNNQNVYTKVDYGNTDFKLDIKQNADVFMSVGVSKGKTEIYGFRITDGCIYSVAYKIVPDKNGNPTVELVEEALLLDMNAKDFKVKTEYLLNKDGAHAIYASVDANKVVSIKVYAPKDSSKIAFLSARVEVAGSNTMFVSTELSQKSSAITFKDPDSNEVLVGSQSATDIRANNGFIIDEFFFGDERVAGVRLYYSKLNNLDAEHLEGKADLYAAGRRYADEGFYLLVVKNLFGNQTVYRIAISRSFGITSSVTFGDGHKIHYSKDYDGKLYSNNEIIMDILDADVEYTVTMNGTPYIGFVTKKEEVVTYLVFSQDGSYEIVLTDSYGNTVTRQFEINRSAYTVADELLTGYNEKALRRDEGYTNQKLTIDQAVYAQEGIYYLAIKYGDALTVLFDAFAETPVEIDAQALIDVIGAQGDGVYTVICRNRYGSVVTKQVHYRATPTLKLERTTRSKSEREIYDLNYALSLGFWSNNTLIFSTEAQKYVFTVNGNVTECPRTLVFESAGDFGSSEYEITYIDEYGFEYRFKAYLVRKNITIDVPAGITGIEVDGILNTKNDISISFGENIYATYTRNNGEETYYRSGEVLKKDGTYRFTVIDYAGNASTFTIKKDTIVEFAFIESVSGSVIQNGSVVNSSKIGIDILNKDSAYIEKVLRDGVVQTDFSGTKFTEDGKWELILGDALGNKAYFCFYIVTHTKNGFTYTTPYEYRITEMWYDSGDGVKVSYLNFVTQNEFTSSFSFRENGTYTAVMTSDVTGSASTFEFTVNTTAPNVSLVGCNAGETTLNDVTVEGCVVGDRVRIYKATDLGEVLVQEVEILSQTTKVPAIVEGGAYRVVVESEAGVSTEFTFVRKHVMNTAGSVFIMIMIGLSVVGLFTGLIYRNKSKTDE